MLIEQLKLDYYRNRFLLHNQIFSLFKKNKQINQKQKVSNFNNNNLKDDRTNRMKNWKIKKKFFKLNKWFQMIFWWFYNQFVKTMLMRILSGKLPSYFYNFHKLFKINSLNFFKVVEVFLRIILSVNMIQVIISFPKMKFNLFIQKT